MNIDAYAWFIVKSAGDFSSETGYICNGDNTVFDPKEFTETVGQEPSKCWKYGDKRESSASRKNQETSYLFSAWFSEQVEANGDDVYEMCDKLVDMFEPYVEGMAAFRQKYDVIFEIEIVLYKVGMETNGLFFSHRLIDFCNRTGTEIDVNTMFASDTTHGK